MTKENPPYVIGSLPFSYTYVRLFTCLYGFYHCPDCLCGANFSLFLVFGARFFLLYVKRAVNATKAFSIFDA